MKTAYGPAWSWWRVSRRRALRTFAGAGLVLGGIACAAGPETPTVSRATPVGVSTPGAAAAARATPTVAPQPKRGGVFRNAALDGPPHLDPHLTTNAVTWGFGVGLWYSRLIKFDVFAPQPAVKLVPDLAESWDQPDDLTYLFKLRPNVKWQNLPPVNGRALTIDDILYSFERMRSPSSPNASLLAVVAKMEAVDRTTFKVTLTQPMADFLINVGSVGNAIVARENVEQKGDLREGPVVGTGPFIVDKVDRQGVSTLVRNPDYFLPGKPYLDSYQYGPLPDSATLLAAFRAGNLDLIPPGILTPTEAETLKRANPAFQFPTYRSYSGTELALRSDRPPFHDVRIRQAVYKAVDSEAIIKAAFGTGWQTVGIPVPAADWLLPEAELRRFYQRDLEGARRLLREAGLEGGLDVTMPYLASSAVYATGGELIIAQLKEANIRVTARPLDYAAFSEQVLIRSEFEIAFGPGVGFSSADGALFGKYHSKGTRNYAKVNDPKLDEMIERQTVLGRRPDERKRLLQEIQRYILEQGYVHAVHSGEHLVGYQPYVRDLQAGGALASEPDRFTHVWLDK